MNTENAPTSEKKTITRKMASGTKTILGIDPGTRLMGYGIVQLDGNRFSFVDMGVLEMRKEADPLARLEMIHEEVSRIIRLREPDCLSIETPFYGKNPQSLIKLGRAQGVAIAAALSLGVKVYEYAPLKIKQSLTGNGSASKEQVCAMVFRLLNLTLEKPRHLDATDALAAAICHGLHCKFENIEGNLPAATRRIPRPGKKKESWADFLSRNPGRIR